MSAPLESLRRREDGCLSDLSIDRLLTGEAVDGAEQHARGCARCSGRIDAARARQAQVQRAVHERKASRSRPRTMLWAYAGGPAVAAGLLVAMLAAHGPRLRVKGSEALDLFVRHRDGRVVQVTPGDPLSPGDAVRFRVSLSSPSYAAIVGIDAAGHVTAYAPTSGSSVQLPAGRNQVLDGSIILDDTLGQESIVAALCAKPFQVQDLVDAGRRALEAAEMKPERVALAWENCHMIEFHIVKVAP